MTDLIPIPRENVMQCTGNEGGYKSFRCLACGAADWEMHFKHKPKCPMLAPQDSPKEGGK
jgi:hypothetical protein